MTPPSTGTQGQPPAAALRREGPRKLSRPIVRGKFLHVGGQKFFLKGVTYGPFASQDNGCEYHDAPTVQADFAQIAACGFNTVRTYTVPPRWLLDIAQQHGLRVMVGLPWEQHVAFLADRKLARGIVRRVREMVKPVAGHPAILAWTVGNEIPATIVRWHGAAAVEKFIHRLYRAVKREDPRGLVTYVNFPTTEYLRLPFLDFVSFNVYLESPDKLTTYLAKLQSHAGDRPLVMAELGLDSMRNSEEKQAEALVWQSRCAFENGCAGLFVFSWTDEWFRGGMEITDWAFGLTTRDRQPKPALAAVSEVFSHLPFAGERDWPRVSVLVCTYNGSRTIRDCCDGLRAVTYPNYEVIVVDDGSNDGVGDMAAEYGYRVIRQANAGLSNARNTALNAAAGEIVVYLDDDARPDPHWLHYIAHTFMTSNHAAVGGPNIAPPGDGPIADCVANAPGGPIHVLISDTIAEHIPGCNFAVRRDCLLDIGGFDAKFRIAGDDVDVCWRLQERGWTVGFAHAAMVWHHRRNSVKAYLRQQKNYGRAESMLEKKWPWKYNAAGHVPWQGRIYSRGNLASFERRRGHIYQGVWGSAPFQSLYQSPPGIISTLPLMPEWYLVIAALAVLSVIGTWWPPLLPAIPLLILALSAPVVQAVMGAMRAEFINPPASYIDLLDKYLVAGLLHFLQPMMRFWGRLRGGLHPLRPRGTTGMALPIPRKAIVWHETWSAPEQHLEMIEERMEKSGAAVRRGGEWDDWDLRISGGLLGGSRLRMAVEEHGQGRQQLRFAIWPTWSAVGWIIIVALMALAGLAAWDHAWVACGILGTGAVGLSFKALREAAASIGAMRAAVKDKQVADHE